MSLNTSGGFCLIKPAKVFMCTQNTGHTVPGVCGHGSLPLNYSGNVTRTEIYLPTSFCLACEAEARHMYCFSGGDSGVNFFAFRSIFRKL